MKREEHFTRVADTRLNLMSLGLLMLFLFGAPALARVSESQIDSVIPVRAQQHSIIGHWEGVITREGKDWRIWLDIRSEGDGLKGTVDLPDYGFYALPLSINLDGSKVRITHALRNELASLEGELAGDRMTGSWKGLQLIAAFQLKHGSALPVAFAQEEVHCKSGEATLAGTLVKPNQPGKHPAIVLTHASGNQTRSRTAYRSMAYLFARHGMAALIYDRRGQGASTGDRARNLAMPVLADDATAWVSALQSRQDINPKQIGIWGLSQGGWVAPLASIRSASIAFVIVVSAAGVTIGEQDDFAVENLITLDGKIPADQLAAVLDLTRRTREFARSGQGDASVLQDEIAKLRSQAWFKSTGLPDGKLEQWDQKVNEFLSFDPLPAWKKVTVPVLAIWGNKDVIVPAEKSRRLIEQSLKQARNQAYLLKTISGADHSIYRLSEKGESWDWPRLAPGYLELMVEWLLKRVDIAK